MGVNYREKLSAVFPPNMTCFVNEEVAYDRIRANIDRYNETKIKGFFPLGQQRRVPKPDRRGIDSGRRGVPANTRRRGRFSWQEWRANP